ncbi:MAG TPA: zinc dependent phospholipase C family protein [Vicinamibacterales bacterium]|nr:zinc dependent phospholipase C family protein [Vicinamibacterales bacterium]
MTRVAALAILLYALCVPRAAHAYSVLAHEALVDAAWDDSIVPLITRRFPRATPDDILQARAFAYGGSVIQDLGYYPFGSHQFTNLVHYVRSGDFVEALLRDASSVDEYAFAIGALSHYSADNTGHPIAVNRSVPLVYPRDLQKFGPVVTYVDDPKRHIMVEFGFDVVQVAGGAYLPDAYRRFIGFEVAKPLLERAFRETYGVEVKDLFLSTDLAIGTFRYAVSRTIPEMTRIAWRDKADDIRKVSPTVQRTAFIYTFTRQEYERAFGTSYRKPGVLARVLATLLKIVPKIGPFRTLAFRAPTPEAERLFTESFRTARDRFKAQLADARDGRIDLANTDFDTGRPAAWGEYALADKTYVDLLHDLSTRDDLAVPPALRRDVLRFFDQPARTASSHLDSSGLSARDLQRVQEELARLRQTA